MEKVLLDTDILSEYLKGHDRNVARHAAGYAREHGVFTVSSGSPSHRWTFMRLRSKSIGSPDFGCPKIGATDAFRP